MTFLIIIKFMRNDLKAQNNNAIKINDCHYKSVLQKVKGFSKVNTLS